ncbi:MAG: Mu-like prophage major head subunit gpT family protein [Gemmatimonadaceae bacterium]|nr:Mu-like prophage major head subunit gpT family protein [Gemmatimonadaceae bacterium]
MTTPQVSTSFGDLLDPRFQRIFFEEKKQLTSMVDTVYTVIPTNGRNNMTFSEIGTLSDWTEFTGNVDFSSMSQGYDVTMTPVEFSKGVQVERKLYDDDQYHIMDQKPKNMVTSGHRKREKDAARIFNNAFSVDSYFYTHTEGVALCSNSHTTTSGASTASGFDNLVTAALSPTAVFAARLQMIGFRDDVGELYDVNPDELWFPPDLSEVAFEILKSAGKVDVATNNRNFHEGRYTPHEYRRLSDTKNWFMTDAQQRKMYLFWCDRIPMEFAFVEDFDTLVAKWRGYMRYAMTYSNWRWVIGSQVT